MVLTYRQHAKPLKLETYNMRDANGRQTISILTFLHLTLDGPDTEPREHIFADSRWCHPTIDMHYMHIPSSSRRNV